MLVGVGAFFAASVIAKRFEPALREQAIKYMQDRFHSEVEIGSLHINRPRMSAVQILLRHGRGAIVAVEGQDISMRFGGDRSRPPMFAIKKLFFTVDLEVLVAPKKSVNFVSIDGMEINVPPKDERPRLGRRRKVQFCNRLSECPDQRCSADAAAEGRRQAAAATSISRACICNRSAPTPPRATTPISRFRNLRAQSKATATLDRGTHSTPGDTPLQGDYTFDNADLGIFTGIAGTLSSKGTFDGALDSVNVRGTTYVPNFQLKMAGNPLPLSTTFEALVDGTNGNTVLQPVRATLGHTNFTTAGAVIKHEEYSKRSINLQVNDAEGRHARPAAAWP